MAEPLKVGDTIYLFDDNARTYDQQTGESKYAAHFRSFRIIGETKFSWLAGSEHRPSKVNKKTMLESVRDFGNRRWYTKTGKQDAIWRNQHRHNIREAIDRLDADGLRKVAKQIGYNEKTGQLDGS